MLLLERKYADILNDEDLTGIHTESKKKKRRIKTNDIEKTNTRTEVTKITHKKTFSGKSSSSSPKDHKVNIMSDSNAINFSSSNQISSELVNINSNKNNNKDSKNSRSKLDLQNYQFIKHLENKKLVNFNPHDRNIELIKTLNLKADTQSFCKHHYNKNNIYLNLNNNGKKSDDDEYSAVTTPLATINALETNSNSNTLANTQNNLNAQVSNSTIKTTVTSNLSSVKREAIVAVNQTKPVYLYSSQKNNFYVDYFNEVREKLLADKNNYYTYSKDYLSLSFPMLKPTNKDYENYLENKKKLYDKNGKDFNRYINPTSEFIYFPKINNQL